MTDFFDFNKTYSNNRVGTGAGTGADDNDCNNSHTSSQDQNQDQIPICTNCGSTSFYRDSSTDNLICNECFTQSQSQSQRETVDHDEVMAVAARSVGGRLKTVMGTGRKRGRGKRKEDFELDSSGGLVSVMECCSACQVLLKLGVRRVAILASPVPVPASVPESFSDRENKFEDKDNHKLREEEKRQRQKQAQFERVLLQKVQTIWFSYLDSWNEAAVYFSQLYPELRLSFRDYFLQQNIRGMLMRYLSAKAVHTVNKKFGLPEDVTDDSVADNDVHGDDENSDNGQNGQNDESTRNQTPSVLLNANLQNLSPIRRKKTNVDQMASGVLLSSSKKRKRKSVVRWVDEVNTEVGDSSASENEYKNESITDDEDDDSIIKLSLRRNRNSTGTCANISNRDQRNTITNTSSNNNNDNNNKKETQDVSYRSPITSIKAMLDQTEGRIDDMNMHPYYTIFKLSPNLNLLSSIIYLALLQCNVGISSHHLISWSMSGLYPYLLNGLCHLPDSVQDVMKRCSCVHAFQQKVLPRPALLDYYADLLIISLGLNGNDNDSNSVARVRMERKNRMERKSYSKSQMNNFPHYQRDKLREQLTEFVIDDKRMQRQQKQQQQQQQQQQQAKKGILSNGKQLERIVSGSDISQCSSNHDLLLPQEYSQDLHHDNYDAFTDTDDLLLAQQEEDEDKKEELSNRSPSLLQRYYQENIPLMAYRFVTDLGLSQRVLDITLALMGFDNSITSYRRRSVFNANSFLPAPLSNASIDKIASPVHLMAVIVVACKMCRGWETWKVHLAPEVAFGNRNSDDMRDSSSNRNKKTSEQNKNSGAIDVLKSAGGDYHTGSDADEDTDSSEELFLTGRSNTNIGTTGTTGTAAPKNISNSTTIRQRFIPWTDNDLNLVGNGKMLNDYFDFIEETYKDDMRSPKLFDDILGLVTSTLEKSSNNGTLKVTAAHQSQDTSTCTTRIQMNTVIAGGTNPNVPSIIRPKDNNFYHFFRLRHKGAIWTDANGYGDYVIYKNMEDHAVTKTSFQEDYEQCRVTCEPFHPHYGLLIEYVADKLFAEPGELHYLVACLDEEISLYRRSHLDYSLERNATIGIVQTIPVKRKRRRRERRHI